MPINIPVPELQDRGLYQLLRDILRRAVDGSLNPVQISVQINVTGNDIKIVTGGNGLILPSRDGAHYGRLLLENPDGNGNMILSVDPLS